MIIMMENSMQTPTITESKMAFNKIDERILTWNSFFPLHRKYKKLQNTSYSIRKVIKLPYIKKIWAI